MIINAQDFKEYLNKNNLKRDTLNAVLVKKQFSDDSNSSILITNEPDYREQINIEFSMRFEHHEYQKETVFQRDFAIEHHPPEKSEHTDPHLQIKIHGNDSNDKVGKLWLTLTLKDDEEYERCIKGFICVLDEITHICKKNLDKELLDLSEIKKIQPEKEFLMNKVKESLEANGIKYKPSEGKKYVISGKNISKILKQDKTLIF